MAGRRVAASAKSWTAPSASAPLLWAPGWPRLPMPPPWAWGLAYAGALGGLLLVAARRRPYGVAPRGLRLGSVAVLATVAPTLIVGCPPAGKPFGSLGDAALFFVTDAVGSTILAIRPNGSVRNRFLYRPYGQKIVNEGNQSSGPENLSHGFAGGAVFRVGGGSLYAFGPRLYDPRVGHFYQPDPLLGNPSSPQTMQPYGYALGDPLRLADPTGLFSEEGPVSSPPSVRLPSFPFSPGIVVAQPKPVNKPGNVPRAPDVGSRFAEGRGVFDVLDDLFPDRVAAGGLLGVGVVFGADVELDTSDLTRIRLLAINLRLGFGLAAKASIRSIGVLATFGKETGSQFPIQFGTIVAGGLPILGIPIGVAADLRVGGDLEGAVVSGGGGIVAGGAVCAPCGTIVIPIENGSPTASPREPRQ